MADISEIWEGLYIQSRFYAVEPGEIPSYSIPIDCSAWLTDDNSDQDEVLDQLSTVVAGLVKANWSVVLICDAGRNRSAVIAARALMVLEGTSADDAITLVRSCREKALARSGGALTNFAFLDWLRSRKSDGSS